MTDAFKRQKNNKLLNQHLIVTPLTTQESILKYWRDVEIFDLSELPDNIGFLKAQHPLT